MLVLSAGDVRRSLPMSEAIQAMKAAYAAVSDGRAQMPLRSRLSVPPHDALALFMPAFVRQSSGDALAVKVVSLFPGNPARGIAYVQSAVLVLEPNTGRPTGLLEGSALTAIRTGAAAGAAIEILSRPESHVLAIFGAGVQGRSQLEAACTAREIRTAWIFDPVAGQAERLVQEMAGVGPIPRDLRAASSAGEAVLQADLISLATTSTIPVFADGDLKPGVHISAVGSYTPEMQETPADTVARARVIVDSRSAALAETGDLIIPIRQGVFGTEHIAAELGEIVLDRKPGRQSPDQITFFKSVGIAAQDAVASQLVLRNARELGLGQEVPF